MSNSRIVKIFSLSRRAFGRYKFQIAVLVALGFAGGLLEGIGVNALIPLFSFFSGEGGESDFISQLIEKFFLFFHIQFNLPCLLVFICVLFIFKAIVLLIFNYIKTSIQLGYENQVRDELFKKTLKADWSHLLKQKLGYLETVLMTDVRMGAGLFAVLSGVIMHFTGLLMYLLVAVNISWSITLITLSVGTLVFLVFKPLLYKSRVVARQTADMNKEVAWHVNENILGMKTVKSMLAEESVAKKGSLQFNQLKNLGIRAFFLKTIAVAFIQPSSVILIAAIFAFSYYTSSLNFVVLAAIIYLIQKIFTYTQMLQSNFHSMNSAAPYLISILHYQSEAVKYEEGNSGGRFKFNDSLEFKNIEFSYIKDRNVLSRIGFIIKKGKMVGLIGFSGAGKTTIVDLILRLFKPISGKILIDNKDISEISIKEWRRNIGYVSQDLFLMNDTITNNIRFYDDSITDKNIIDASRMAYIYDFIQELPQKFDTVIGERGIFLSAGQRQRIAIARVLVRKPEILLLDEATSALDNESEMQIQKAIENLKGQITILVIAHRLSTVMNCDRLFVLENGKIVEQGAPGELLKDKQSYFYKTYNIRK